MVFQESYSSAFFISASLASSACGQAHSHHPPPGWGEGGVLVSAEQLKDMCQIVTIVLEGVSRTLFYCYILVITFPA